MAIPAEPNDGSLLSSIFISSDDQAYDRAADILDMFGLPNPAEREFFAGNNADRVYLNTHGLCFSFVYRRPEYLKMALSTVFRRNAVAAPVYEARKLVDERILQPLAQIDLSPNCCLEILPGVERVGATMQETARLAKVLKNHNINFYSPEPDFVGVIKDPESDRKLRLVVNRRAIKPLNGCSFEEEAGAGVQDIIYGALREEFADVLKRGSGQAAYDAMENCRKIVTLSSEDSAKILHSHWREPGTSERRRSMSNAAYAFQRRLTQ